MHASSRQVPVHKLNVAVVVHVWFASSLGYMVTVIINLAVCSTSLVYTNSIWGKPGRTPHKRLINARNNICMVVYPSSACHLIVSTYWAACNMSCSKVCIVKTTATMCSNSAHLCNNITLVVTLFIFKMSLIQGQRTVTSVESAANENEDSSRDENERESPSSVTWSESA